MDSLVLTKLNTNLCEIKKNMNSTFGGVNVIFLGDFLQLPSVSKLDVYKNIKSRPYGHILWRSLNAVVILRQQMHQSDDPRYATLLWNLRLRQPTQEDIDLLNTRVGVTLPNQIALPTIIRRRSLRDTINNQCIQEAARRSGATIRYCRAIVTKRKKMSMSMAYNARYGAQVLSSGILPLIPGCPLMITKNISSELGIILRSFSFHTDYRSR
jgi:hypothetical protein